MKSDLRNLVTAEEAYFADSIKYTTTKSCVNPAPAGSVAFCTTTGNTLRSEEHTSEPQSQFQAVGSNPHTDKSCEIYVGATTPALGIATSEGAPACK